MEQTIFKVGDEVYDYDFGKGIIEEISEGGVYAILVQFKGIKERFLSDGRFTRGNKNPRLSFTPYDLVNGGFSQKRQVVLPKRGQLVWVKLNNGWECVYYSHTNDDGKTISALTQDERQQFNYRVWQIECPLPLQIKID
jgi:hypothetical protein